MPVAAVTATGRPTVSAASSTAQSATRAALETPFFSVAPTVMMLTGVASDPGPGGRRHQRQRQPPPGRFADSPQRVEILAAADEIGRKLRHIHRAAAAEADHGRAALPRRHRRHQRLARRVRLDGVEYPRFGPRVVKSGKRRIGEAEPAQLRIGDEQARARGKQLREAVRCAGAGDQARPVEELIGCHGKVVARNAPRRKPAGARVCSVEPESPHPFHHRRSTV
jgi:hypothetical protein